MKNILTIKGQSYEIEHYYEFESCLSGELEIVIEDFEFYDKIKQTKILQAFDVSTLEELNKIDVSEFNLDKIIETLGNLDITYYYSGIDFDGQIDSMYIDDYYEEERETANLYTYNGVNPKWFY